MYIGRAIVEVERLADEGISSCFSFLPEVFDSVRGLGDWCFGCIGKVDAAKKDRSALGISEEGGRGMKVIRWHWWRM